MSDGEPNWNRRATNVHEYLLPGGCLEEVLPRQPLDEQCRRPQSCPQHCGLDNQRLSGGKIHTSSPSTKQPCHFVVLKPLRIPESVHVLLVFHVGIGTLHNE
jgi:hypothetical protein